MKLMKMLKQNFTQNSRIGKLANPLITHLEEELSVSEESISSSKSIQVIKNDFSKSDDNNINSGMKWIPELNNESLEEET